MKKRLVLLLSVTMAFSMFANVALGAPATSKNAKSNQRKYVAHRATVTSNASAADKMETSSPEKLKEINDTYGKYFDKLKELGLVQGRSDGQAHLDKTVVRRESAKLVADFYAKNDPAFATKLTEKKNSLKENPSKFSYKDTNYSQSGEIAEIEALTDKGIVQGKDLTKKIFGINEDVTVEEATHMFANVVKSAGTKLPESASNNASDWAKSTYQLALNSDWVSKDANPKAKALRGQLMQMAVKALEMVGLQVTKYEVLDPKKVKFTMSDGQTIEVPLEKALEANKETEVSFTYKNKEGKEFKITHKVTYKITAAQKIENVTATNLKEVNIKFNGDVESKSAENVNNYKIPDFDFESATLSADKKEVKLLIKQNSRKLPKQQEVTLELKCVKSSDSSRTFNEKVRFTALDNKVPEVTEVKGLGTKAFKVIFSEPVTDESARDLSKYKIDGKSISGSVKKFTYPNVVVIQTDLAVGDYTLTVEGVEDFAGFKSGKEEKKFTVANDSEAPKVLSAKARDLSKVEVEFDESVESISKAYHTSSHKTADIEIKDTKAILTFKDGNTLPSSLTDTMIYLQGVKDYSGNSANRDTKLTSEVDTGRPSIVKAEVKTESGNTRFTIELSKPLLRSDVNYRKNYILRDSKGDVYKGYGFDSYGHPENEPTFAREKNGGKETDNTVTFNSNGKLPTGKYTIEVSGLRDTAVPANTMSPETISVEVTDADKFQAINASWKEDGDNYKVYVHYNRKVATSGNSDATQAGKYAFLTENGSTKTSYSLGSTYARATAYDNHTLVITVPKKDAEKLPDAKYLRINGVSDSTGSVDSNNHISQEEISLTHKDKTFVKFGKLRATAKDRAIIEFEGLLDSVNYQDFVFNTSESFTANKLPNNSGTSRAEVEFKFSKNVFHTDAANITVKTASTVYTKNKFDYKIESISSPKPFTDEIKPEVNRSTIFVPSQENGKHYVVVTFDEPIGTAVERPDFEVTVGGDSVRTTDLSMQRLSGDDNKKVKIGLKLEDTNKDITGKSVRLHLKDKLIGDARGNFADNFTVDFTAVSNTDTQAQSTTGTSTTVTVMDEAVTAANEAKKVADEAVRVAGEAVTAAANAAEDVKAAAAKAKKAAKTAQTAAKTAQDKADEAKKDTNKAGAERAKAAAAEAKKAAEAAKTDAEAVKKAADKAAAPGAADTAAGEANTAITTAINTIQEVEKVVTPRGVKLKVATVKSQLEEAGEKVTAVGAKLTAAKTATGATKTGTYKDAVDEATEAVKAVKAATETATEAEAETAETATNIKATVTAFKDALKAAETKVKALKTKAEAVRDANQ